MILVNIENALQNKYNYSINMLVWLSSWVIYLKRIAEVTEIA